MNFRIFSKKHNLYTNSPNWPSNQRSSSEWFLAPNGDIVEAIDYGGLEFMLEHHDDPRNFEVEPWTGYFDSKGQKIYRGDILGSFKGIYDEIDPSYETEVVWHEGGFYCKDERTTPDSWMPLDIENRAWKRHFIKGNIHGVEF